MTVLLWILAVLIGVPLVLALIPLRYRIAAKTGEETSARITVSYLLHFFHITILYADKKTEIVIRVAGIRLEGKALKKVNKPRAEKNTGVKKKTPAPVKEEPVTQEKEKKDFKKIFDEIKAVLTRKDLKIIIGLLFKYTAKMFRYLLPKRFTVTGVVGLSDPFQTGIFIGACDAVTGTLNKNRHVRLAGDFNQKTVRININASGRVSAMGLLLPLVWLISRKPVFNLILEYINKVRKNKKSKG